MTVQSIYKLISLLLVVFWCGIGYAAYELLQILKGVK